MDRLTRVRGSRAAFEDRTWADQRNTGMYMLEFEGPPGFLVTDNISFRAARVMARSRTQCHHAVTLTHLEDYDPPALG